MRIVVFGAAGWLGRAILAACAAGHEVIAFDRSEKDWDTWEDLGPSWSGARVHGDISDFPTVYAAVAGADAVIHAAAYFGQEDNDSLPWMVNLKGLWNVLDSARRLHLRRVVHIGSRETVHPLGGFFDSERRRPGGGVYPVTKRLQEEMGRSFFDSHDLRTIVLCPDYIVDSRLGLGRFRERLGPEGTPLRNGWVCRHDLAEACRLAVENDSIGFDIFHIVGTAEADATCNVARSREELGLVYRGNLEQFRMP